VRIGLGCGLVWGADWIGVRISLGCGLDWMLIGLGCGLD